MHREMNGERAVEAMKTPIQAEHFVSNEWLTLLLQSIHVHEWCTNTLIEKWAKYRTVNL